MSKSDRNHTIDILKGIAIILVLITHYEWTAGQRRFVLFPYLINMAIPIFMIITGYVYSASQERSCGSSIEKAYSLKRIFRRIVRYTLPFLVIVIWELLDPKISLSYAPLDVMRWCIDGTVGKGSYYFPVMLQMIFLFPLVYFIIDRKGPKGLWYCLIFNAIYEILAWAYFIGDDTYRLISFRYIFLIASGVYAFKGYKLKLPVGFTMSIAGSSFITILTYYGYETRIFHSAWASTSFLSSMLIIPLMIWVLQNVRISFKPLEILGQASYHIFLVQMVYYLGYYELLGKKISSTAGHLALGCVICLGIGTAFYFAEKPLQNWIQGKIKKA
ncbi:MAG: acyltransferase [Clostridiales bacterium]|nr:acyltransferase [Clostridiales bacterium]